MITENKSCISWSGFNLMGDEKSVSEVQRLLARSDRLEALDKLLDSKRLGYTKPSQAQAVAPMLVPEGWAIVPVIMTDAMDKAGWPANTAQEGWERAIAAAPSPTNNEGE